MRRKIEMWTDIISAALLGVIAGELGFYLWLQTRPQPPYVVAAPPVKDVRKTNDLVTSPPMVGDVTLFHWLKDRHPLKDAVWPAVVKEFYTRAANVDEIADYFNGVDMERLQLHFHRALVLVCDKGLTEGTIVVMRTKHASVRNSAKEPITYEIYDAVIDTLVAILREQQVPETALVQLGQTVEPLRDVIARG
jgi:hypothetical protein